MPTAYDVPGRIPPDDRNPLSNLLNFNDIDLTAHTAGTSLRDGLVPLLSSLTGFDFGGGFAFLTPVFDIVEGFLSLFGGLIEPALNFLSLIPNLFNGIDFSNPLNLNPINLAL